jgi:D-serine deaminase-like pyridoxal phosphate-dependent protein
MSDRIEQIDTPALLFDLDLVERNVTSMAEVPRDAGVALRPHVKTHKSPEFARMQVEGALEGSRSRSSVRPR